LANILDLVDVNQLRKEVQTKYREVADEPGGEYHFHTGRAHAVRLGYPRPILERLPVEACEAFAGMANPFYWETPKLGERVVDLGSGGGMDSFVASLCVGSEGRVIGIDMTPEMLDRSRRVADQYGFANVEFRQGYIEHAPIEDKWADVVISNGVINLCPDKLGVCREIARMLRPGGRMMIADICIDKPIPESALRDIDLWTG
jgi:SAM-dependent methyltransferase